MYYVLIGLFVVICFCLIGIILLQSGKSGGLGAGISGGGAFNDAFGGQGADKLLTKVTTFLAICFMVIAFLLTIWKF